MLSNGSFELLLLVSLLVQARPIAWVPLSYGLIRRDSRAFSNLLGRRYGWFGAMDVMLSGSGESTIMGRLT